MSAILAAAIGGAVGALALIALFVFLLWFCVFRRKNLSRTSETGSSDPSTQGKCIINHKSHQNSIPLFLSLSIDFLGWYLYFFRRKKCCN